MAIRVFVAYNQKVIAESVAAMLRTHPDIEVVGVCDSHNFNLSLLERERKKTVIHLQV
jgi:uncharacterized SAM-dependent methyltransferase